MILSLDEEEHVKVIYISKESVCGGGEFNQKTKQSLILNILIQDNKMTASKSFYQRERKKKEGKCEA